MHSMYRERQCTILMLICLMTNVGTFSVYGQSDLQPSQNLTELITGSAGALNQKLENVSGFVAEFTPFKQRVDSQLGAMHSRLEQIIEDYADHGGGLLESSQKLIGDLEAFSSELNGIPGGFPRFEEVKAIIEPEVNQFIQVMKSQFPALGPAPKSGNPLGNLIEFYQEAERRNSFGMGSVFKLEYLRPQVQSQTMQERVHETTHAGVVENKVSFREIKEFQDDELVFHQIIKDGEIVLDISKVIDLSFLHSLPSQLRQDGADDRIIRLIEEYINIVNYHVVKNIEENGLVIAPYAQPSVPAGYSPDVFVRNFITLILGFKTSTGKG